MLEIPRQTIIKALEETSLIYLNKDKFLDLDVVEKVDMDHIRSLVCPIDVEKIAVAVLSIRLNAKMRVNPISFNI